MRPVIFVLAVVVLAVTGAAIHAVGFPTDWAPARPGFSIGTVHAELGRMPFDGSWVNVAVVHHRDLPRYSEDQRVFYIENGFRIGFSTGDTVVGFTTQRCTYCRRRARTPRVESVFVVE